MAIVSKTMDEILKEMTPERIAFETHRLEFHIEEYDSENPPLTKEELKNLRPYREAKVERELIKRFKAGNSTLNTVEREKARQIIKKHSQANILISA